MINNTLTDPLLDFFCMMDTGPHFLFFSVCQVVASRQAADSTSLFLLRILLYIPVSKDSFRRKKVFAFDGSEHTYICEFDELHGNGNGNGQWHGRLSRDAQINSTLGIYCGVVEMGLRHGHGQKILFSFLLCLMLVVVRVHHS